MSSTKHLRKLIKDTIQQIGVKAYYESATQDDPFPYVTYEFDSINVSDQARREASVIIDIWDKSNDSGNIEDLADSIEEAFHYKNLRTDKILSSAYCVSRLSLPDENPLIKRRQISVLVKYYTVRSEKNVY